MAKRIVTICTVVVLSLSLTTFAPNAALADDTCTQAQELRLGDTAPCTGILISEDMARELGYWLEYGPALEDALHTCDHQLSLSLDAPEPTMSHQLLKLQMVSVSC